MICGAAPGGVVSDAVGGDDHCTAPRCDERHSQLTLRRSGATRVSPAGAVESGPGTQTGGRDCGATRLAGNLPRDCLTASGRS